MMKQNQTVFTVLSLKKMVVVCCTKNWGPYKRTLIAALDAYPGGAGVHEGATVDKLKKGLPPLPRRLVFVFHFTMILSLASNTMLKSPKVITGKITLLSIITCCLRKAST